MEEPQRLRIAIRGAVQGVGFRPFVYKLATSMGLKGWIVNSSAGVFIEVEGQVDKLREFLPRVESEKPTHAYIQSLESSFLDPKGFQTFEIGNSVDTGKKTALVLPDIATCPQCLKELFDPKNRRYRYPFTNCTLCGPRYTIIESLPYDRSATSMKGFPMCSECRKEYEDPKNRRFHAQPNACPVCGPEVYACAGEGSAVAEGPSAISVVVEKLKAGKIAAVKGLGGFHLMVDAGNAFAIKRLRERKRRSEKPFAVMIETIRMVQEDCDVDALERRLLLSSESPIVLLNRRDRLGASRISSDVAPGNPTLGAMLPYTPLHHILMRLFNAPLVATSGNLSDEPICIEEREAFKRLKHIADIFLLHNRPILRHVDDSVVRVVAGRELVIRRSRGYAPLPVHLAASGKPKLAVGAHQKNTVAFQIGKNAIVSQHIGDLETEQAYKAFESSIDSLRELFEVKPESIIRDIHRDYLSSQYAEEQTIHKQTVQHHHAHIASCMAENHLTGSVLGVSWDGTGAGRDGTIWGGEFLRGTEKQMERISHFRLFKLPGGEQAVKEPRRSALGLLFEIFGEDLIRLVHLPTVSAFSADELQLVVQMMKADFHSPRTSSAGRLFDAVSSLIGIRQIATFEGQGAMELEHRISEKEVGEVYPFAVSDFIDWEPTIKKILEDLRLGIEPSIIAKKFHNTLVETIIGIASSTNEKRVVLSGGCFQNRYLVERTVARLKQEGFHPYWHQRIPPNDGGIALGQLYATI